MGHSPDNSVYERQVSSAAAWCRYCSLTHLWIEKSCHTAYMSTRSHACHDQHAEFQQHTQALENDLNINLVIQKQL